jgi:hypothetical protein
MDKNQFKKFLRECIEEVLADNLQNKKDDLEEMTGTGAVAGFMGANWVDKDPNRTKMKSIAKKSVGGKLA